MKTNVFTQKLSFKTLGFIGILMLTLLAFNPSYGQATNNERTVKGLISDENGPLADVNVVQEGTSNGTVTNKKGEFTFPVKLKTGDVLLVSYLGFSTQKITIKEDTSFIDIVLTEDLVEIIGALDSGKPYKSKRKKN